MPQQSFNTGNWRLTGRYRLRPGLFFGSVLEEQREYGDGSVRWVKAQWPLRLADGRSPPFRYLPGLRLWSTGRRRIRNGLFGARIEELMYQRGYPDETFWHRVEVALELPAFSDAPR